MSSSEKTTQNVCHKLGYYPVPGESSDVKGRHVIYMDYQATTPMDPRVIDATIDAFKNDFGNPHSRSHIYGWTAEKIIEKSRKKVAKVINAEPSEIIFTSGATESNNLAISGVAHYCKTEFKNHIITLSTEHKCVIESCRALENEGFKVTYLKPKPNGIVDLDTLKEAITPETIMISIMAVNNEIGVIQPLKEIGTIAREKKVFFHTDAAQAFGKIHIDVNEMNIDLLSISAHKIYGPKGIGALYVRKKPRVRLVPLLKGGGQERNLRSGTLPTPLIAGFGVAAEIAMEDFEKDQAHIKHLSDILYDKLSKLPEVFLNGDRQQRHLGNLNFSFSHIEGESLIMAIKNIAVSSGSACTSSSLEGSYVLRSLGVKDELAHSSIRFGIGRFSTLEEINTVAEDIIKAVERLRAMSPLWEMFEAGIDLSTIEWDTH